MRFYGFHPVAIGTWRGWVILYRCVTVTRAANSFGNLHTSSHGCTPCATTVTFMVTGDDVKHARGRLRLTQTQLAGMLGVSRRTVAEWEGNGAGELSATITGRLSGVFADAGPATPNTPPLASTARSSGRAGRRLASLRSQLDAAAAANAVETDITPRTGHRTDDTGLASETGYPSDGGASGVVGTEIRDDDTDDSPRFTDRPNAG